MTSFGNGLKTAASVAVSFALLLSAGIALADPLSDKAIEVENRIEGRVGVAMHDLKTGKRWGYRADELFPMSSTFKPILCAAVLARVDAGEEELSRRISFLESDLVTYSPVTETKVENGMTVGELCEATLRTSDNSAANFLLGTIGGPEALTMFIRNTGDTITRLDRLETDLNEGVPGDERDTTTPNAMIATLKNLLFSDVLSEESRKQLADWMMANEVSDNLIRTHLPSNWRIGDRSGAGGYGSRSISAVIWPSEGGAVLAAIYITENDEEFPVRNEAVSEIGAAMVLEIEAQK